jgi:MscS family membrane protein
MNELQNLFQISTDPGVWTTQMFVVVAATLSLNFVLMRVIDWGKRIVSKTDSIWDDALLDASRMPLRLLTWLLGLSLCTKLLEKAGPAEIFHYMPELRRIAFIFIVALFLTRLIRQFEEQLIRPRRALKSMDPTTAHAVAKLLRVSVIVTAVLVTLQTMGYSVSGVLAFGGIGGIAVGFAAKDLLSNFFGGLMIYMDKPFAVGDWIRSPDRAIEGTVEDIGWRLTRIRTFDKRPLYIPNSTFASIAVENPSRMTHRRICENLGLRYEDGPRMSHICDSIRQMLLEHPEIDRTQTLVVHFTGYGASHLEFMVYCLTLTTDWVKFHAVKEDVLLRIMQIVADNGAEFAFPTQTLHLASTPAETAPSAPLPEALRQMPPRVQMP